MIIFVNNKNEIKDVNVTKDTSLRPYEIAESDLNPFANWPVAKICCYRIALVPETITEIIGAEDVTYTNLDGEEVTETREIKQTRETGKYIVTMMTPYVDTRLMEHIAKLGSKDEMIEADVTDTQLALVENYDQTLILEEDLTDTQLGLVENYAQTMATAEEVTDCQLALVELYDLILGGM